MYFHDIAYFFRRQKIMKNEFILSNLTEYIKQNYSEEKN